MITVQDLIDASTLAHPRPYEEVEAVIQYSNTKKLSDDEKFFIEEMASASRKTQDFMQELIESSPLSSLALDKVKTLSPDENKDAASARTVCDEAFSPGRMARIRALVSEQALVHHRIMTTVREQEREHPSDSYMSPPSPSASSRGPSARYQQATAPKIGSQQKPETLETREVNARIVAEKLQKKQARADLFKRRRQECLAEQEKDREAVCTALEAADRLYEKHVQERSQRHAEKIYQQQQKHSDQKKMLHEIQRDQEREWKLLQEKNYAHQMRRPASSPALLRKKKAPVVEQQEQVYTDMMQSHLLYSGTIANWQELEADNERRNEAMWQKRLPGGKQVKRVASKSSIVAKQLRAQSPDASPTSPTFHVRTPSEVSTVTNAYDASEDKCMETTPWGMWGARMERVRDHQRSLDLAHQEKRVRDLEKLEAIRSRGKDQTQKRARKAEAGMVNWERKAKAAAQKRSTSSKSNQVEYFAKQESRSLVRAESLAAKTELRDQIVSAADNHREATLQNSKDLRTEVAHSRQSLLELKDSRARANREIQVEGYSSPSAKAHAEEARIKIETKQAYEDEFRKKAEADILEKQSRSPIKGKKNESPVEALRRITQMSKNKRSPRQVERELTMSEQQPPAVILMPSPGLALALPITNRKKGASSTDDTEGGDNTRSSVGDDVEQLVPKEGDGSLSRPRSSNSRTSKTSWSNSRTAPKFQASQATQVVAASTGATKRLKDIIPCDDGSSSADEDEDFLQELRTRSSKWLEEAKTKSSSPFFL